MVLVSPTLEIVPSPIACERLARIVGRISVPPNVSSMYPLSQPGLCSPRRPIVDESVGGVTLDHTSDEFKTIIQEHYRRTPSLRKLADIHGVSRSTVHRIVQAQ